MKLTNFSNPYINVWIFIAAFGIAELVIPSVQFFPAILALLFIKISHFLIDLFVHLRRKRKGA